MKSLLIITSVLISSTLMGHGDVNITTAQIDKEIAKDPKNPELHLRKALNFYHHEHWQEALSSLNTSQELDPEHTDFDFFFGKVHYGKASYQLALKSFDESIKKLPESKLNFYYRGQTQFKLKNFSSACRDLDIAASRFPKANIDAFLKQAQAHELNKETGLPVAIKLMEQHYEKFKLPILASELLSLYQKNKNFDKALILINVMIKERNQDLALAYQKALILIELQQKPAARKFLLTMRQKTKSWPQYLRKRAHIKKTLEKIELKIKELGEMNE